ncbi:TPA: hypothetical protein JD656_RS05040 [Morganella morganii]|uniref:hypothetical protein n=1 Tax=Morganella morganii TaxID=582 RepID=UPI00126A5C35|nr:hypothetical protein [Morganella morganii]HCD1105340.1 hypothetical protein [Morganella morganii]
MRSLVKEKTIVNGIDRPAVFFITFEPPISSATLATTCATPHSERVGIQIGNTGIKTPSYAATPAVVEEMVNINQLR